MIQATYMYKINIPIIYYIYYKKCYNYNDFVIILGFIFFLFNIIFKKLQSVLLKLF